MEGEGDGSNARHDEQRRDPRRPAFQARPTDGCLGKGRGGDLAAGAGGDLLVPRLPLGRGTAGAGGTAPVARPSAVRQGPAPALENGTPPGPEPAGAPSCTPGQTSRETRT